MRQVRCPVVPMMISLLLASTCAEATTTYHVSATGGDDTHDGVTWATAKRTIQGAVDAAATDDTILVSNGVYYLAQEIVLNKGVTLKAAGTPRNSIIDGSNVCRCLNIQQTNAVIDGFSIRNGFTTNVGGGIVSYFGGVLRNCSIYNNVTSNSPSSFFNPGGGLYMEGAVIEDCAIYSNRTSSSNGGGGARIDNSPTTPSTMRRCEVYGNTSVGSGGGIRASDSIVEDCSSHDNHSNYGSGVNAGNGATYSRCRVFNNGPGGVWLAGGTMQNCLIYSNGAEGVLIKSGMLRSCLIYSNNTAGVRIETGDATVENCTITRNGVGVSVRSGYAPTNVFRNVILYGNFTGVSETNYMCESNATFACDFSCVSPIPTNGTGNIDDGPVFADAAQMDYRLRAGSPCIDAGTNLDWMLTATDVEGQPRIFNGRADMGADETFLAALGITQTGQVVISWQTVIDARNQLQYSTNLLSTNWSNIGGVSTAAQWQVTGIDTNPIDASRFYRVLWLRP